MILFYSDVSNQNLFKEDEAYEKCAIIKSRMDEVNKILKKNNKKWLKD